MRRSFGIACVFITLSVWVAAASEGKNPSGSPRFATWRGVHIMAPGKEELPLLKRAIVEGMKPLDVNVLILELNYRFEFQSHPELREGGELSRTDVRDLAAFCRARGIRLIPQ